MGVHGFGHAWLWYSISSTLFYHATTLFYHVPLIILSSPCPGQAEVPLRDHIMHHGSQLAVHGLYSEADEAARRSIPVRQVRCRLCSRREAASERRQREVGLLRNPAQGQPQRGEQTKRVVGART